MATLTESDLTYIRMMSGDDGSLDADPKQPEVSDAQIQILHDLPADDGCGCTNPNDTTVVWVLRARVAKAQKLIDETNEQAITRSLSQKRAALEKDLARWEKKCGMDLALVSVGKFNLGLDATSGSEWASLPRWWLRLVGII